MSTFCLAKLLRKEISNKGYVIRLRLATRWQARLLHKH